MKNKPILKPLYVLFVLAFAFLVYMPSCKIFKGKQSRKAQASLLQPDTLLSKSLFTYNTLEAKAKINALINNNEQSFTAILRLKKDSLLWVSVSPFLGIEMARICLTPDSIKVMNRMERSYFVADIAYLEQMTGAPIGFDMLQSVLCGNDFESYTTEGMNAVLKEGGYELKCISRKCIAEACQDRENIKQEMILDTLLLKIIKNSFSDIEEKYNFEALYSNFKNIGTQYMAQDAIFNIKNDTLQWRIFINYARINTDVNLTFPFTIPESYTPIQ